MTIEELQAENERLKNELQQSATNCYKLRCLALHAMSEYFRCQWRFLFQKTTTSDNYYKQMIKYKEAHYKAKHELREGK